MKLLDANGVEAVRRLVQDEQMRVREQGECDSQPLLHAHGETARALAAHVAEPRFGKYLVDTLLGQAEERRADAQVLPCREIGVERRLFDERADAVEVVAAPAGGCR